MKSLVEEIDSIFESCMKIIEAKNSDYAGDRSPFFNFEMCEKSGVCKTEHGIIVRMTDKLARVINLLEDGREAAVRDETIEDTLKDLINYTAILLAYLRQR